MHLQESVEDLCRQNAVADSSICRVEVVSPAAAAMGPLFCLRSRPTVSLTLDSSCPGTGTKWPWFSLACKAACKMWTPTLSQHGKNVFCDVAPRQTNHIRTNKLRHPSSKKRAETQIFPGSWFFGATNPWQAEATLTNPIWSNHQIACAEPCWTLETMKSCKIT